MRKQLLQLVKELQNLVMQKMLKGLRVRKKKLIKKRTQKKVSLKKNNIQLKNLIKSVSYTHLTLPTNREV